jgi:predicted metal-dependent hydrolase
LNKKTANTLDKIIEVAGFTLPCRIYYERRSNVRVSLGKDFVILRIPSYAANETQKHLLFTTQWLEKLAKSKPEALRKYQIDKYEENYSFTILDQYQYTVVVHEVEATHAEIKSDKSLNLTITIPLGLNNQMKRKIIRTLISRLIALRHKPYIVDRIAYWNTIAFKKKIGRISLKYNSTNWGSCSTSSNINLSTRALLLPKEMLDYIIVHELSHLVQMNHSQKFWDVVAQVMPDYEQRENWISKNGGKLDF